MNRQMWQPSVAETNFSPVKMISSSIYPGGPVRDEINKSAAVPPVQQPWTMPDKGTTIRRRMTADPFERLHGSPTPVLIHIEPSSHMKHRQDHCTKKLHKV